MLPRLSGTLINFFVEIFVTSDVLEEAKVWAGRFNRSVWIPHVLNSGLASLPLGLAVGVLQPDIPGGEGLLPCRVLATVLILKFLDPLG